MARGKTSRQKLYQGDISCMNCPCGWEVSFNMKDQRLMKRMINRAQQNHIKVCGQVTSWGNTYCESNFSGSKQGLDIIRNNMKEENIKDITKKKEPPHTPV